MRMHRLFFCQNISDLTGPLGDDRFLVSESIGMLCCKAAIDHRDNADC